MKKYLFLIIVLLFHINNIYADSILTIEIHNVTVNGGTVYVSIFYNEQAFRNKTANMVFPIDPINNIVQHEITLPDGGYVISIYQDVNGNGKMDYGLFRIPKEPYGFSNMQGKIPGSFNALKIVIGNSNRRIIIPLVNY